MYSTCLFCHRSLGSNAVIEHFPIGRRLAFDPEKGRLWVICSLCLRWNLTPIEERWEAIEACERLFRAQRLRAHTENIGLTKLREGLELVRVGRPLRPEFAAWRYGNVFGARLRRTAAWVGGGVAAAGVGAAVGMATGVLQVVAPFLITPLLLPPAAAVVQFIRSYRDHMLPVHVPRGGEQRPYLLYRAQIKKTDFTPGAEPGSWILNLRHVAGTESLTGERARRALAILLAKVNAAGAATSTTRAAAERVADAGGPEQYVAALAATSRKRTGNFWERLARFRRYGTTGEVDRWGRPLHWHWDAGKDREPVNKGALPYLTLEERLALEISVNEESERRALEEELAPLEAAWREAEEIAQIADDLFTPKSQQDFINRHRARR